MLNQKQAVLV